MFLTKTPTLEFSNPWTVQMGERLTQLGSGSQHVAYFYPRPDTSTFRYRVLNMIEALTVANTRVGASWFSTGDLGRLEEVFDLADVIVLSRCKYSADFAQLIVRARAQGKRVLFDVDDLVFDDRYIQLILNTLDLPADEMTLDFWFARVGRHGALMKLCDGVIVTNDYLAQLAHTFSGLPTMVVPNFMNHAQIAHSAEILNDKCASGFARDGRIHVGYFSGSATHNRDFAVAADALSVLMDADPRIVLRIVGHLDTGLHFAKFDDRVEVLPFQNILNLQRLIGEVEINVVPLQDNIFTNCKSELKVFEASAVGTISIGSPCFTISRAIVDGQTGFLAPTHQWREQLLLAIDRLDRYPEMAMAAARLTLERYVPEVQAPTLIAALFGSDSICNLDEQSI